DFGKRSIENAVTFGGDGQQLAGVPALPQPSLDALGLPQRERALARPDTEIHRRLNIGSTAPSSPRCSSTVVAFVADAGCGSASSPNNSAAASPRGPCPASARRRVVGAWRSLLTMALAMARTVFCCFSSSPFSAASVFSASARASDSACARNRASTGIAARSRDGDSGCLAGELLRMLRAAVGHQQLAGAGGAELPGGQLRHLAGTEEEDGTPLQIAEELVGELDGDPGDRHGAARDLRFRANALRGRSGAGQRPGELRTERACPLRLEGRVLHL